MVSRIFLRCSSASAVSLQRASMFCCIFEQTERLEYRTELIDRLVRARHYLFCNRRTLLRIAGEQFWAGLAFDDMRELPGKVEGILDRRVGPKSVGRRVPVSGVSHAEDAAVRRLRRIQVVHGPRGHL